MEPEPYLKCACESCGAHIEFPPDGVGQTIACPHCQQITKLAPADETPVKAEEPSPKKTSWILIAAGCVALLGAAGAGLFFARNHTSKPAPEKASVEISKTSATTNATETPANPRRASKRPELEKNGLQAFHAKLEKSNKGRLVYATGIVRNKSEKSRFGVKVELDLLDTKGTKLGSASDYVQVIEPGKEWKFHALVTEPDAVGAKVVGLTEE